MSPAVKIIPFFRIFVSIFQKDQSLLPKTEDQTANLSYSEDINLTVNSKLVLHNLNPWPINTYVFIEIVKNKKKKLQIFGQKKFWSSSPIHP